MALNSDDKTYPFEIPVHHLMAVEIDQAPRGVP